MAAIKLSTLQECDQALSTAAANLKYYNFIYVEAGTGMDRDSGMKAYWDNNYVGQDDLKKVLKGMEDKEIQNAEHPITSNNFLVFHQSRGDKDDDYSASVFFRVFALTQPELTKLNGGLQASAVEIININYNAGTVRVKVKKVDGSIEDRIVVNLDKFKITIGSTDYFLIWDVVGIGYHLSIKSQDKYKMVCYNQNVLSGTDINLGE